MKEQKPNQRELEKTPGKEQIAREAADKIEMVDGFNRGTPKARLKAQAIILSALEKAHQDGWHEGRQYQVEFGGAAQPQRSEQEEKEIAESGAWKCTAKELSAEIAKLGAASSEPCDSPRHGATDTCPRCGQGAASSERLKQVQADIAKAWKHAATSSEPHPTLGHDMAPITQIKSSEPPTQEVIEIDASGKAQSPFTEPNPHSSEPQKQWTGSIGGLITDANRKPIAVALDIENAKAVADAHNAALAAAVKPYNDGWLDQMARDSREIVRLELQLAAEREKLKGVMADITNERQLHQQQLLAAQVVIAKHNKQVTDHGRSHWLIDIDLSALEQHDKEVVGKVKDQFRPTIRRIHDIAEKRGWKGGETQSALDYLELSDAEVRKPLVEALEEIQLIIPPKPKLPIVVQIKEVADAALASVKEGK